jgi:hypothetical protein
MFCGETNPLIGRRGLSPAEMACLAFSKRNGGATVAENSVVKLASKGTWLPAETRCALVSMIALIVARQSA